ncbi:MAG: hypothetical protein AAGC67_18060 [Myxococcota bacterium]
MAREGLQTDPVSENATDAKHFDFERLERAVAFLLEEHERLSSEKAALLDELVERESRITSLEATLDRERSTRRSAVEGVDKILARLEQLQASATAAAGPA